MHNSYSRLMPLEYLTPPFEKVNVFCRSSPVARSTYCRTCDSAHHTAKNDVIQPREDCRAGGRVMREGSLCVEEDPEKSTFGFVHRCRRIPSASMFRMQNNRNVKILEET